MTMIYFYTGIHEWCVFKGLYDMVAPALPDSPRLTKMDMLVMFFLKIRLNLFDEDIADRFNVHRTTASRNFHRVLDVMFVKTAHLIKWPDRETLNLTMPMSFRKFFKRCCVIIDCSEVFIECPTNLLARAQVWSNYKHHSTIKFLIGITPQGTISYISHCVGGRMSDKEIVEQSTLLNYLLPGENKITVHVDCSHVIIIMLAGDVILADRGFTCDEYARMAMATIKMPPFTKGKKQLEKMEIDWSRELSLVRIHVERVIGVLKQKYTILQNIVPISLIPDKNDTLSTIDKIVCVCCACVNLCPSVIPQD